MAPAASSRHIQKVTALGVRSAPQGAVGVAHVYTQPCVTVQEQLDAPITPLLFHGNMLVIHFVCSEHLGERTEF